MKILNLATKKLNLMFGSEHEQREQLFKEFYLYKWYEVIRKTAGLTIPQLAEFCYCCEKFKIKILGFETSYESRHGLNTYPWEEYNSVYYEEWWLNALADLERNEITDSLIPYIDIPENILNEYIE